MSEAASQRGIISNKFQRLLNTLAVGGRRSGYTEEFFYDVRSDDGIFNARIKYFIDKLSRLDRAVLNNLI